MFKKMIAMFIILSMLMPISSVVAVDTPDVLPTIEEILFEYNRKSLEVMLENNSCGEPNVSRSVTNTDELELETVETLKERDMRLIMLRQIIMNYLR